MSSRFWSIAEPAQADYEQLRTIVLAGGELGEILAARRFTRQGLAGLVSWPASEPAYVGSVVGARDPRWCGSEDPREQRLRDVYRFLLADRDSYRLRAVGECESGFTRACRPSAGTSAARSAHSLRPCALPLGRMGMR